MGADSGGAAISAAAFGARKKSGELRRFSRNFSRAGADDQDDDGVLDGGGGAASFDAPKEKGGAPEIWGEVCVAANPAGARSVANQRPSHRAGRTGRGGFFPVRSATNSSSLAHRKYGFVVRSHPIVDVGVCP
jgi:hypothetical protein